MYGCKSKLYVCAYAGLLTVASSVNRFFLELKFCVKERGHLCSSPVDTKLYKLNLHKPFYVEPMD
jgi:hypothetical protein